MAHTTLHGIAEIFPWPIVKWSQLPTALLTTLAVTHFSSTHLHKDAQLVCISAADSKSLCCCSLSTGAQPLLLWPCQSQRWKPRWGWVGHSIARMRLQHSSCHTCWPNSITKCSCRAELLPFLLSTQFWPKHRQTDNQLDHAMTPLIFSLTLEMSHFHV